MTTTLPESLQMLIDMAEDRKRVADEQARIKEDQRKDALKIQEWRIQAAVARDTDPYIAEHMRPTGLITSHYVGRFSVTIDLPGFFPFKVAMYGDSDGNWKLDESDGYHRFKSGSDMLGTDDLGEILLWTRMPEGFEE